MEDDARACEKQDGKRRQRRAPRVKKDFLVLRGLFAAIFGNICCRVILPHSSCFARCHMLRFNTMLSAAAKCSLSALLTLATKPDGQHVRVVDLAGEADIPHPTSRSW